MIITQLKYGVSVPVGDYEHVKIDAFASVEEGETPEEALIKMQEWVAGRISEIGGRRHMVEEIQDAQVILDDLQIRIEEARERYYKMQKFLAQFNVNLSAYSDMPF